MNITQKVILPLLPLAIASCNGNKPNKQTQDKQSAEIELTYEADSIADKSFYQCYYNIPISNRKAQSTNSLKQNSQKLIPSVIAQEIADEIFKVGKPQLDKPIAKINSDNVFNVLEEYKKISDEKNSLLGKLIDDETLFEAILDESISKEKKKVYLNHIKTMMEQSIAKDQGNTEFTSIEFEKAIENTLKKSWSFQKPDELNDCAAKFFEIRTQINSLKKASNEKAASRGEVYNDIEEFNQDKTFPDILGDGKFNNNAMQIRGTCWIHGNVNAMVQTKKGREYLNNIIYKNPKNGNISVYLKVAKDEGLPKGRKDGIFTFTEEEIAEATRWHSIGDGDYTALILAIDDYIKTTNNTLFTQPDAEGGSPYQFYSIFFGENIKYTVLLDPWHNSRDKDAKYNEIRKYFKEEQGVISVSLSSSKYIVRDLDSEDEGLFAGIISNDHACAIKDMTDEYVYLTDSNHPWKPAKVSKDTFVECFAAALWEF